MKSRCMTDVSIYRELCFVESGPMSCESWLLECLGVSGLA